MPEKAVTPTADTRDAARHRRSEKAHRIRQQREAVDSRNLWHGADVMPKNQGHHDNRYVETCTEADLGLGWPMAELLGAAK